MKPSIILFAILLSSPLLMAQAPTVNAAPNTLFTGADGKFDAPPDTALVQFNLRCTGSCINLTIRKASATGWINGRNSNPGSGR